VELEALLLGVGVRQLHVVEKLTLAEFLVLGDQRDFVVTVGEAENPVLSSDRLHEGRSLGGLLGRVFGHGLLSFGENSAAAGWPGTGDGIEFSGEGFG
jgi:hypothetical protein